MEFQIILFVLWGLLWAVYFMLDGFDFGVGMLLPFLGKDGKEKAMVIKTIGPVWDGNEVWLITAGAVTFAAFPETYALMFSYLYSAVLLILFSLILRGVSLEFWGKVESARWKIIWSACISVGSLVPALLFGIVFGNIFRGLPMDAAGYHGTLMSLLNPYGILVGVLFVVLFLLHGSLWLTLKTADSPSEAAAEVADKLWYILVVISVGLFIYTGYATRLFLNYSGNGILLVIPASAVFSFIAMKVLSLRRQYAKAFFFSSLVVLMITMTAIIGLYPNLIPSSVDPNYSLTIFNSSSSFYTLKIMIVVTLIFLPIVISCQIWVYRVFRHRVKASDVSGEETGY